ncbi:MAG: PD40 domain-containing protein [Acidobacteriia bacterium]|nr:PD40 domain-containing protein [Terriglobia bacterium]
MRPLAAILSLACCLTAEESRLVWGEANLLGAPSRDGQWMSYVDGQSGELAVRELASGKSRTLTHKKTEGEFAYFSVLAPDGKSVAYAWFNAEGFYELRVVGTDGAGERILYRNEEAGFVQPCAWTPDGKQILTLLFRKDNISQIAMVALVGGVARVLKSLQWVYPNRMDISPDGKLIVYDSPASNGSMQRDIYALSVDGSRETPLVSGTGNDIFPLWKRDGKAVVYVRDAGGAADIWDQAVAEGNAVGEPRKVAGDVGRVLPLGITEKGDYYFGRRAGVVDVMVAELDGKTEPVKVSANLAGVNLAPAWSGDGKHLAWLTRLGSENFGQESRVISVADLESRKQRVLPVRLPHMERLRWSPDDKDLLVSGTDRQGRRGLYVVNVETGAARGVVQERAGTYHGLEGVWSADGNSIVYLGDGIRLRKLAEGPAEGNEKVLRAGGAGKLGNLEIAPDGKWLAYTMEGKVMVVGVDGGEWRQVASLRESGAMGLEWLRDSTGLLVSVPGVPPGLWRVSLSGKAEKLGTRLERVDGVRLHPDGRRVAYTAGKVWEEVRVIGLGK